MYVGLIIKSSLCFSLKKIIITLIVYINYNVYIKLSQLNKISDFMKQIVFLSSIQGLLLDQV